MTETDRAYTAGILDGDGSIKIERREKGKGYWLRVEVTQKDIPIVRWLEETWRGSYVNGPYENTGFHWYIGGRAAAPFLREILPYLILKKREAEVGIEFQEFKDRFHRMHSRPGRPYPPEYQTQARVYYHLMRSLKNRSEEGPFPSPITDPQLSLRLLLEDTAP